MCLSLLIKEGETKRGEEPFAVLTRQPLSVPLTKKIHSQGKGFFSCLAGGYIHDDIAECDILDHLIRGWKDGNADEVIKLYKLRGKIGITVSVMDPIDAPCPVPNQQFSTYEWAKHSCLYMYTSVNHKQV